MCFDTMLPTVEDRHSDGVDVAAAKDGYRAANVLHHDRECFFLDMECSPKYIKTSFCTV